MLNRLRVLFLIACTLTLFTAASNAVITLESTEVNGTNDLNNDEGPISIGPGNSRDFEILICTTFSDGDDFFDEPPAGFEPLDAGECGGPGDCILGILTGFAPSSSPSNILCAWVDITQVYGGGSFRYSGVDRDDPVIDSACESGTGGTATAPSIITEPNSAVIRVAAFGSVLAGVFVQPNQVLDGTFISAQISNSGQAIEIQGLSFSNEEGGPTGTLDIPFSFLPGSSGWRACTIAIRMSQNHIPTLSEWGLGIFAALFGIAAVWALRRRAVRA